MPSLSARVCETKGRSRKEKRGKAEAEVVKQITRDVQDSDRHSEGKPVFSGRKAT